MTNIGEPFLTHHRDMGTDVSYVSDYVDNHQQMSLDLRESEQEFQKLNKLKDSFLLTCDDQKHAQKVQENFTTMHHKLDKLKNSVERRIKVADNYLLLVKKIGQFRSLALDLQELFKSLSVNASSESIFENHVQEKIESFEQLYRELMHSGQILLDCLNQVLLSS